MIKEVNNSIKRWIGRFVKIRLKDGRYYNCKIQKECYDDSFIVVDKNNKTVQIFNSDVSVIEDIGGGKI